MEDYYKYRYEQIQSRYESEAFVEKIAHRLDKEYQLSQRTWEDEDERRLAIYRIVQSAVDYWGLDDAQSLYLEELLRDL